MSNVCSGCGHLISSHLYGMAECRVREGGKGKFCPCRRATPNTHLGEVEEEDFDGDDLMICDTCKKLLAVVRKPEYPGGYAWPYFYCDNPECSEYGKEQ